MLSIGVTLSASDACNALTYNTGDTHWTSPVPPLFFVLYWTCDLEKLTLFLFYSGYGVDHNSCGS